MKHAGTCFGKNPTLDEVCEFIVDCLHKTAPTQAVGYPSIRTPNVGRGRLILEGVNRVSEDVYVEWTKRAIPEPGDLIMAREAPAGNVAIIGEGQTVCLGQRTVQLRPDREKVDPDFLCYYLLAPRQQGALLASQTGVTAGHVNMRDIRSLHLGSLPNLSTQRKLGQTLAAYDDLIENNRRRIALLEEAARLLYREWFVHFRFPGHEHVVVNDGVPEGWEKFALSELADFVNGYAFKPTQLGEDGLPIVKIPELRQGVTDKTPRNDGELIPEKFHIRDGDLLFSWSGTLAVNVWAGGPALLNQHLFHVIPSDRVGRGFLMCAIRGALAALDNQTVGATMKHIRRSALDQIYVALGDRTLTAPVEDVLHTTYEQLVVLHQQNQKLAQARDLLLPRLMSGEVVV